MTSDASTVNVFASATASPLSNSARYTAPELLHSENSAPDAPLSTPESDVYALAMVMWEVFTGRPPFFEYARESTVILRVMMGMRPGDSHASDRHVEGQSEEPVPGAETVGLRREMWKLMQVCWRAEWRSRPRVPVVRSMLEEFEKAWTPPVRGPVRWPLIDNKRCEPMEGQNGEVDEAGPPGALFDLL